MFRTSLAIIHILRFPPSLAVWLSGCLAVLLSGCLAAFVPLSPIIHIPMFLAALLPLYF
jgi:hypothetical protein